MSKDRIFSSAIMISLAIGGVLNQWIFIAVVLALTVGGLYEFFYLLKKKGYPIYSYTGLAIGTLIPIFIFFQFELTSKVEYFFILFSLLLIFIMQLAQKDNENAVVGISTTLFGIIYVSWLFSYLIKIRFLFPEIPGAGMKLLGFILLITKMGDVGALLIGKQWGKHPLMPTVSPNKTVEGSLGSALFSGITAVLAAQLIPVELNFSVLHIAFIGIFFGAIGQLGDLSESLIKRDFNVKDSGKMLPALGGALDTMDSLLFSAPAFYFYISSLTIFG